MESSPPAWRMCTKSEAIDRQSHMELSEFESTSNTFHLPPTKRVAHPQLTIKKYRRSAAGGGVSSTVSYRNRSIPFTTPPRKKQSRFRSVTDLNMVVNHLLQQVFTQRRTHDVMEPRSLAKTVSFVDDRLRAVQVDYVTYYSLICANKEDVSSVMNSMAELSDDIQNMSLHSSQFSSDLDGFQFKNSNNNNHADLAMAKRRGILESFIGLQAKIIRYNILVGYLLYELPALKFEKKFNAKALQTSLTHFFENVTSWESCLPQEQSSYGNRGNNIGRQMKDVGVVDVNEIDIDNHEENDDYASDNVHTDCQDDRVDYNEINLDEQEEGDGDDKSNRDSSLMMRIYDFQDEMMCYSSLLQSCSVILSREGYEVPMCDNAGEGLNAIMTIGLHAKLSEFTYPKWKWSLEIASALESSNYVRFFRLINDTAFKENTRINEDPPCLVDDDSSSSDRGGHNRWLILSRCCVFPVLHLIRKDAVRQYNKSFAKGEKVSDTDLSRLLCISSSMPEEAIQFCKSIGLPTAMSSSVEDDWGAEDDLVVMKAAPVLSTAVEDKGSLASGKSREDTFVFCNEGGGGVPFMQKDLDRVSIPSSDYILELIQ